MSNDHSGQPEALEAGKSPDNVKPVVIGSGGSSAFGPSYCKLCGEWPARQTSKGLRCHLCECRDICADNPVPLPEGRECLQDLASIGVPGAAAKLALLPNTKVSHGA